MKTSGYSLVLSSALVCVPAFLLRQPCRPDDLPPQTAKPRPSTPSAPRSPASKFSFPFNVQIKIFDTPTPSPTLPTSRGTFAGQPLQISFDALFGKPGREMDLWIESEGKSIRKAVAWRCVDRSAADDTGQQLLLPFYPLTWHWSRVQPEERAMFSIKLAAPAGQARFIEEYSGNLEFIVPQNDPTSHMVLDRFRTSMGKPLQSPALKKLGVTVVVLTKENYDQRKVRTDATSKALVRDFTPVFANSHSRFNVAIRVKNAQEILGRVAFTDPKGREVPHDGCALMNSFVDCAFKSRVPDSTRLTLEFATPKSVVKVPFELKHIPLANRKPFPGEQ